MAPFTHLDEKGSVRMVDVSEKPATPREAVAQGVVTMQLETFDLIMDHKVKKGNVLETARIAGVMAAKRTADLIPMCHPLSITHVRIDFSPDPETHSIRIESAVRVVGKTGVEMEALTAVSIAALTIYDMCKSHDRGMTISDVCLARKSGGKSGTFVRGAL
jgi:cyclic pyranopterin phosphate synthase